MLTSLARGLSILNRTYRGYRGTMATLFGLSALSAILDGISIASIVPLLAFLTSPESLPADALTSFIQGIFGALGIPFKFRFMLMFLAALITTRVAVLALFVMVRASLSSRFLSEQIQRYYTLTLQAGWPFIVREKAGYLQNTILWDTKRVGNLLDAIAQFAQSCVGFLIYLIVAINISPLVMAVTLVAGTVLLFVLRPFMGRTHTLGEATSALEKSIAQHIVEHIHGFKTLKSTGAANAAIESARAQTSAMQSVFSKAIITQGIGSIFIQPFSFLFAMAIFAFTYYLGTFNIAAFAATLYLIQKIFVYLDSTQSSVNSMIQFIPFAENLLAFKARVEAGREPGESGTRQFSFDRQISFKDVSFAYEDGKNALSHVSFNIPKGSAVGIIGASGGGKTTVADLLLRLFVPSSGEILVDGVPVSDIRAQDWRKHIGYVSQDAFLLHTSIRDNIRFYDESVSDADIEYGAKAAHVYDDVMRLPDGFDTVIGDRGATLSGGQRQRLSLARILARRPKILVLDEVTSSLDSELEAQIQEVIRDLHGSVTLLIIAHRISTVLSADSIVVMEKGTVVEVGSPSKMRADPASYLSRILEIQGSGFRE